MRPFVCCRRRGAQGHLPSRRSDFQRPAPYRSDHSRLLIAELEAWAAKFRLYLKDEGPALAQLWKRDLSDIRAYSEAVDKLVQGGGTSNLVCFR